MIWPKDAILFVDTFLPLCSNRKSGHLVVEDNIMLKSDVIKMKPLHITFHNDLWRIKTVPSNHRHLLITVLIMLRMPTGPHLRDYVWRIGMAEDTLELIIRRTKIYQGGGVPEFGGHTIFLISVLGIPGLKLSSIRDFLISYYFRICNLPSFFRESYDFSISRI